MTTDGGYSGPEAEEACARHKIEVARQGSRMRSVDGQRAAIARR